jgi:aerobic-type carbon monoxide dehydrogenase small subunit (CoxS/CutS family)
MKWSESPVAVVGPGGQPLIMEATITFTINGQRQSITTDPQRPLLDVLREDLNLTGTKFGCGEGQCLACTVLMNGKAVPSCITPISSADKQELLTIEGVSKGDQLHPVQQAFLAEGASQCGYCTPGMILGAISLLNENPKLSAAEIPARMQRHMCRCGTYPQIVQAIARAAAGSAK